MKTRKFARLTTCILLAADCSSATAASYTGFTDYFALGHWNQSHPSLIDTAPTGPEPDNAPIDGAVYVYSASDYWDQGNEEFSVNADAPQIDTQFTIEAPEDGQVTFSWLWISNDDGPEYDPLSFLSDQDLIQLTDDSGLTTGNISGGGYDDWGQAGSGSFDVISGTIFGFQMSNLGGDFGGGTALIYDFAFAGTAQPPAVPLPAAAWLFLSGLAGLAGLRARQNRTAGRKAPSKSVIA